MTTLLPVGTDFYPGLTQTNIDDIVSLYHQDLEDRGLKWICDIGFNTPYWQELWSSDIDKMTNFDHLRYVEKCD